MTGTVEKGDVGTKRHNVKTKGSQTFNVITVRSGVESGNTHFVKNGIFQDDTDLGRGR